MPRTILSVLDFGAAPDGRDCTSALVRAARACQRLRGVTLVIPPGRYAISPARGSETWTAISNHDNLTSRRVALHLVGCHDLLVEGQGAELVATGHVVPVLIEGGADVVITGLTIDWAIPLHGWGEVVGAWNGWMDLRLSGGHAWRIIKERLCYLVDGAPEEVWGTYGIDPQGMVPALKSGDNCGSAFTLPWVAEALEDGVVRLHTHLVVPPTTGHLMILRHGLRIAPALAVVGCERITLRGVTIGQAGGMAVVMQRCTDPVLERVQVIATHGRPLSANQDATHFVACRGTVRLSACRFERQLDDATNVHGIYQPIVEVLDARSLVVRLVHGQQRGNLTALPGEHLRIIDRDSMLDRDQVTVAEVRAVNAEFCELVLASPLPASATVGQLIENVDWKPDIAIHGCTIAHNRARGLLIASGTEVVISDNDFESPGPAIQLHGDTRFWYEAGAVGRTRITGNRFRRCGYAQEPRWGTAVITAAPEFEQHAGPFHGELLVEGNTFSDSQLPLVDARGVGRVVVRGNQVQGSAATVVHRECGAVLQD